MLAPDNPKRAIRLPLDRILRQSTKPRLVLLAFGQCQRQTGDLGGVVRGAKRLKMLHVLCIKVLKRTRAIRLILIEF